MLRDAVAPRVQLGRMILGSWFTQAIYVAAELRIADTLADGPRDVAMLARLSGVRPDPLHRLLRALASVGIFVEEGEGRFALTPLAQQLRSDAPGSQRWLALMAGAELYRSWGELLVSVRNGNPAFDATFGMPFFQYLSERPERGRIFDGAMTAAHGAETDALLDAYDFSSLRTVIDVGGGNGTQLAAILRRHPALEGVLFDLPSVASAAEDVLAEAGVSQRARVAGGDFFAAVPGGGDLYVLRHVVHDWRDAEAVAILRNCRAAMPVDGKILLVETVIPPGNGPCFGKWLDLMMLVVGGRERTEAQYRELLRAAGFDRVRVVPTAHEVSAIEARPAA